MAGTTSSPHAVLITEVLYDPAGDGLEPGGEYAMLQNMLAEPVTMINWSLRDGKSNTLLPAFALAPHETVAVAASELAREAATSFGGRWIVLDGRIGNGLGNSGDELALQDSVGEIIDALSWGNNTNVFAPPVALTGSGLALKRYRFPDTDSAADWAPTANASEPDPGEGRADGVPSGTQQPKQSGSAAVEMGRPEATVSVISPRQARPVGGRLSLSEVAPALGWVELYNPQAQPHSLAGWRLDDDNPATPPVELDATLVLEPYHFLVIPAPHLEYGMQSSIRLMRPDGGLGDSLTLTIATTDTTWSRFPVQGGGWQPFTPATPGDFNQPAPITPTLTPNPSREPVKAVEVTRQVPAVAADAEPLTAAQGFQLIDWRSWWPWLIGLPVCVICGSWMLAHKRHESQAAGNPQISDELQLEPAADEPGVLDQART